jgi:RNA polymerase sigma-70 factor (ECF subfamily)
MATACEPMANTQTGYLEELFWAHNERVIRAAYRITGNMADAEDVAQAVFIRLAGTSRDSIANAESYLYRAAINGALDLLRRRKSEVELDTAGDVVSSAPANSPERLLSSKELAAWLRKALTGVSPVAAEMFVLRFIEDLDNAQIARMLGTSRAVVAVRLHQVRAKLKKDYQSFIRGGK